MDSPAQAAPLTIANLYQRLARIAGDIKGMKGTGRTAQGTATFSISDIEDALRPLFARHGVVSGYTWNGLPTVVEEYQRVDRTTGEVRPGQKVYQCDLTVWFVNADTPSDKREDRLIDFASSPSGAVSFALKRYYRAVFHLSEEEDETAGAKPSAQGQAVPKGPTRPAVSTGAAPATSGSPTPRPQPAPPAAPPIPPAASTEGHVPGSTRAANNAALLASVRAAGKALKSPATDAALMAMARGKWRGQTFKRLEDLSNEQLEALDKALSHLVDMQNTATPQAAPPTPAPDTQERVEDGEPFDPGEPLLGSDRQDVPF